MRLSVSTLSFWDIGKDTNESIGRDINKVIKYIGNYRVGGVELNIPAKILKDFKLTKENFEYLAGLRWNTLHSPGLNKDNIDSFAKKLNGLYREINAVGINFHPLQFKGEYNLREYFKECNITVENVNIENEHAKNADEMIPEIKKILASDKEIGFCLDSAHVKDLDELRVYIEEFEDRIRCVHASDSGRHRFDHILFYKSENDERLREVIKLDKPLIIEGVMEKWSDMEREFKFIRKCALGVG